MLDCASPQGSYITNEKNSSVNAKNKHVKINIVENASRTCKNVNRKYKLMPDVLNAITCLLTS